MQVFYKYSLISLLWTSLTWGFLVVDFNTDISCTPHLDSSNLIAEHEGRQIDQGEYRDIKKELSGLLDNVMEIKHKLSRLAPCTMEPCQNGGTCKNHTTMGRTMCDCKDGFAGTKCEINVNQTCFCDTTLLIPHPNKCQLYYNCSQVVSPLPTGYERYPYIPTKPRPAYLHECPFPQLFSAAKLTCQNYTEVSCGTRYETKNKCDYLKEGYQCLGACKICSFIHPDCEGHPDGIFPKYGYGSQNFLFFECKDERIVYNVNFPCPSNMAPYNGKCTDKFQIPIEYPWLGYAKDCRGEQNGNYRSERGGRCDIYYTCTNDNTTMSLCPKGKVFDVKTSFCQDPDNACPPCGNAKVGCP